MRAMQRMVSISAATALAVGLAGCSTGSESGGEPSDTGSSDTSMSSDSHTDGSEGGEDSSNSEAVQPMSTGDPFADAKTAAEHMPPTAQTLTSGFVAALDIPGEADSDAADLRATLTSLLQEHVYLAGIAVATAYAAGPESSEFDAATAALDQNSVALSEAVGSLAGEDNGQEFLDLWRKHIGYFVDYAVAVAGDESQAAQEAQANLGQYTEDAGSFFDEISDGELSAGDMSTALQMHVDKLSAAIDAFAAESTDAYSKLQEAATHVTKAASVITDGLVAATDMDGDPNDEASTLRSDLTSVLQEHVYLASVAVFTAYTVDGGTESEAFEAAAAELDENSVALSDAVGSLAGEDQGEAFLDLWREHIGYFVDYASAIATGDEEGAETALTNLNDYRSEAGEFFDEVSDGELPADAIADSLSTHVQTLAGAIASLNEALVQNK